MVTLMTQGPEAVRRRWLAQLSLALLVAWAGLNVSVIGDELLNFAISVVAARGHLSVALVGFVIGLPAFLGIWIGTWAGRRRRSAGRWLVAASLLGAAVVLVMWMTWNTKAVAAVAYSGVFVLGVLKLVTATIWQSSLPGIAGAVTKDDVRRLMGWTITTFGVGAIVGPLVAGLLDSVVGARGLLMLDVATFVAAAALFVPVVVRMHRSARNASPDSEPAVARMRWYEGMRAIIREPLVRSPTLCLAVMNFLTFGVSTSIPLIFLDRGLSVRAVGLVTAGLMYGSLMGSVISSRLRKDRMFWFYLVSEPALRSVGLLIMASSSSVTLVVLGAAVSTVPQGMGKVARQSNLATAFDGEMRFRVMGAYQTLIRGAMPLAPVVMYAVVSSLGSVTFLVASAVALILLGIAMAGDRGLRAQLLYLPEATAN